MSVVLSVPVRLAVGMRVHDSLSLRMIRQKKTKLRVKIKWDWTVSLKKVPFIPPQLWLQAVLAVGASWRVRHSLETFVVYSTSEQAANPGQPSLPHPRVVWCPAAKRKHCTHWPPTSSVFVSGIWTVFSGLTVDLRFCFLLLLLLFPGVVTLVFSIQAGSNQKQLEERLDDIDGHFFCIIIQRLDAFGPSQVMTDL